MTKIDLLKYEIDNWETGKQVLGIDEAGFGCFAGSMFVAGVSFTPMVEIPVELRKVKDSKKLTEAERFRLEPLIKDMCNYWFCEEVTVDEINESDNIYWLRFITAEHRIATTYHKEVQGNVVVYDGNKSLRLANLGCQSECLVKGDSKSFSIAAASILAKAAKDREMLKKDQMCPEYEFKHNKGYYSKQHAHALKTFGMSEHHRHKYCRNHI